MEAPSRSTQICGYFSCAGAVTMFIRHQLAKNLGQIISDEKQLEDDSSLPILNTLPTLGIQSSSCVSQRGCLA